MVHLTPLSVADTHRYVFLRRCLIWLLIEAPCRCFMLNLHNHYFIVIQAGMIYIKQPKQLVTNEVYHVIINSKLSVNRLDDRKG